MFGKKPIKKLWLMLGGIQAGKYFTTGSHQSGQVANQFGPVLLRVKAFAL